MGNNQQAKKTTLSFTDEQLIALGEELMIAKTVLLNKSKYNFESGVYDRLCDITKRKNITFSPFKSKRYISVHGDTSWRLTTTEEVA